MANWTETDLQKLKDAIAANQGVREITFADQRIVFQSVDEMLKLLSTVTAEVNATTRRNFRVSSYSKGL